MNHDNYGNALLFWCAQFLNVLAITADGLPGWAKVIIAFAGLMLTVVSLINQTVILYEKSKKWFIVIIIKERVFKKKKRHDG